MSLSIQDIEKTKLGSVWAVNKTSGIDRSNIIFTVPKSGGNGLDVVEVLATFVPINLTDQVPRRQLLESSEFRRAIAKGFISIIAEEEAITMLEEDGVAEEQERLRNLSNATKANAQLAALDGVRAIDPALSGKDSPVLDTTIDGIVAGVVSYIETLKSEEASETATLNSLRSMGELTKEDYTWVAKVSLNKWPRINKWANRQLA